MSIEYTIKKDQGYFLTTWIGNITDDDLMELYTRLYKDKDYEPGLNELVDLREAQLGGLTTKGLRDLASSTEEFLDGKAEEVKVAVIATEDLSFGFARMYQSLTQDSAENVKVFREPADALKWIGAEGPLFE